MAWVSTEEQWDGRSSSAGQDGARKYSRKFLVQMDSMLDDSLAVRLAPGVPRIRDPYVVGASSDLGARCVSVDADQSSNGPFLWEVKVEYSTQQTEPGQEQENPLARPAKLRWGNADFQKPIERDRNGKAYLSSAGEPFDPHREVDAGRLTLTIEKNQANYDPVFALSFKDKVNSDYWFGFAPGKVKCRSITGDTATENDFSFFAVTSSFEMREEGWTDYVLDRGFTYLDDNGALVSFRDNEGSLVQSPKLLNGAGKPLDDAVTTVSGGPMGANDNFLFIDGAHTGRFPPAPFVVLIEEEKILVTATNGNAWTITRAHLGTTKVEHAFGAAIAQEPYYTAFEPYFERPFGLLNLP